MLNIVADENIPGLDGLFGAHATIQRAAGRDLTAEQLQQADALIVRSVTEVNQALLAGSRVQFVGTCTIGTDHLDQAYLAQQQIAWASAPGCNARGVVDYVLSCLLSLAERSGRDLFSLVIGVVGVGQVGSRLVELLQGLGIKVLICDPPRAAMEADFKSTALTELLATCDLISLHTPLTKEGEQATYHLLNERNLPLLKAGAWLINASRGGVVDNSALLAFLAQRPDVLTAFDVWEGEPRVNRDLVEACTLATPHIAGYSLDGKLRGTEMIYQAFCEHFSIAQPQTMQYPVAPVTSVQLGAVDNPQQLFKQLCRLVYDVRSDDAAFRLSLKAENPAQAFDQLRKFYPERRELPDLKVQGSAQSAELTRYLAAVGITGA